jgi:tryptophan synthase alpha chain
MEYFRRMKSLKLKNPFLIGFGVSNAKTYSQVGEYAAGAIVGSAFISMLKTSSKLETDISSFIQTLKNT